MHIDNKCRLCWEVSSDLSNTLYDSSGGCTEVYEITVKYFDPMLLVNDSFYNFVSQSTIICQECWTHINNFHGFQENILQSQSRLTIDVKPLLEEGKNEGTAAICDEYKPSSGNSVFAPLQKNTNYSVDEEKLENVGNKGINKPQAIPDSDKGDEAKLVLEGDGVKKEYQLISNLKNIGNESIDMKGDLNFNEHSTSYDIPLGEIISSNETPEPSSLHKKNWRKTIKCKQGDTGNKNHKCKSNRVLDKEKTTSEIKARNSSEKIQELDAFIAEIKPQLECELCKNIFPNYNTLRAHFTDVHQMKCFIMCCDRKIYRRYLLVEHLRLHVNPETFKCEICGAISASSRTLIAHKRFMHCTSKSLECEICHRKFKGKPTLIRHMATHATGSKDFKCAQCDRCFAFEFQLKLHINNVHSEIKICHQCGKTVHGAAALKQHLLQHSEGKQTKWPCDHCDAQLASLWGLKSHKLSFHPDGTTAFICKECGKVASSETTLKRHKRLVHQLERKYKCNYCLKAFKKNSHLKDHIAIHTGQHIHQCALCSQTFINSGSLHKHRKKIHPAEWNESRQHRIDLPKVNADIVLREVLL